jgi:hypothetical protein
LCVFMGIQGIGKSPRSSLGTYYIDSNVQEKTRTGFYLGINKVDSIDGSISLTTLVPPASPVGQFIWNLSFLVTPTHINNAQFFLSSFITYYWILNKNNTVGALMEQELPILPERLSSSMYFVQFMLIVP